MDLIADKENIVDNRTNATLALTCESIRYNVIGNENDWSLVFLQWTVSSIASIFNLSQPINAKKACHSINLSMFNQDGKFAHHTSALLLANRHDDFVWNQLIGIVVDRRKHLITRVDGYSHTRVDGYSHKRKKNHSYTNGMLLFYNTFIHEYTL